MVRMWTRPARAFSFWGRSMELLVELTPADVTRLRRHARGSGGFCGLAGAIADRARLRSDGWLVSALDGELARRFVAARETRSDGGWQRALRLLDVALLDDDGRMTSDWNEVRRRVLRAEPTLFGGDDAAC